MNTTDPLISVIIPTYNRCALLRRTLDALRGQDYPATQFEVIVVLDGCTDETHAFLDRYEAPYRLVAVEQPHQGPAAARNRGAAAARGRWLLFLDDDVAPAPGCIAAHLAAHGEHPNRVVVGPYLPALRARASYAEMHMRAWWHDVFRATRQPAHRFTYADCMSGNCSLPRKLFERVGGFDERFPAAHEDYELGIRLLKASATLHHCATAHAEHDLGASCDTSTLLRRRRNEGLADALIGQRHPEVTSRLAVASLRRPRGRRSRLLHDLAFSRPTLGDALAGAMQFWLTVYQRLQMRRRWERLYASLARYWYLRGVTELLGTEAALQTLLDDHVPELATSEADELLIDLSEGIAPAIALIDRLRPGGVRLVFGGMVIGHIPALPGGEGLRGIHLQSFLATQLLWPLFIALVQQEAIANRPSSAAPAALTPASAPSLANPLESRTSHGS